MLLYFCNYMAGEWIALAATLSFVLSNVLFRKCEHEASPLFINTFRTLIGVFTFFIIAAVSGIFPLIFLLSWDLWLWLILSFVFGQVLGDTSYFMAQRELGPTKALAISMTYPLFSFVLSVIFLNQAFEWWILLSFLFISTGVLIIAKAQIKETQNIVQKPPTPQNFQEISEHNKNSDLIPRKTIFAIGLSIIASLGWAIGLVIIDYATNQINNRLDLGASSSVLGNVIRFPAAFIILSGILASKENKKIRSISRSTYFWLFLASLIGTSLGAFLYTEAARVAGATIMSLMATANPLFSIPIAYLINREKITPLALLGVIIIMAGVIIILIN